MAYGYPVNVVKKAFLAKCPTFIVVTNSRQTFLKRVPRTKSGIVKDFPVNPDSNGVYTEKCPANKIYDWLDFPSKS